LNPACPNCSTAMELIRWHDITGFECPSCKGHLVRAKQLVQVLEKHGSDKFGTFTALVRAAPVSQRELACTACGTHSFRSLRHGVVEIDVCGSCMSVYFDAGEATLYFRQSLVRKLGTHAANTTLDTVDNLGSLFDLINDFLC
jgi:Zn-finger nucleic acid-binding protein